jgi:hypothetical protein
MCRSIPIPRQHPGKSCPASLDTPRRRGAGGALAEHQV